MDKYFHLFLKVDNAIIHSVKCGEKTEKTTVLRLYTVGRTFERSRLEYLVFPRASVIDYGNL